MFGEQVGKLQAARQLARQWQKRVDDSYEEWRLGHGTLIARAEQAKMDLKEIEDDLRVDIVAHYQETGDKKPHPKLGVRVSMVPHYNVTMVTEYCKLHLTDLMVLDAKQFDKYVKAIAGASGIIGGKLGKFVSFDEKITATIARNLE